MRFRSKLGGIAASTLVLGLWGAGFAGVASADTGSNVTTVPIITPTGAANPEIQNDEPVQLVVPNGDLTPGTVEHIYECDDPTGDIASADFQAPSPTSHPVISPSTCDHNMDPGGLTSNAQGGLTTPDPNSAPANTFYIYALPPANAQDQVFLNESGSVANCNATTECILYIGPSLSSPYDGAGVVYSQPFYVDQHYDYANGNPAPADGGFDAPEVALNILLPLAAASLLGGAYLIMRRRKVAVSI